MTPRTNCSYNSSDIRGFDDVFSEKLSDRLPLMRDIQHAIDFIPGSTLQLVSLQNESAEHAELKSQVDDL